MYKKDIDITAIGELLVDFTESGTSAQGNPLLEANPGGAPCNLLAMASKLGKRTAFIGKVGNDGFGRMLAEAAEGVGIDCSGLAYDEEVPTTLAFVHKLANGDRDFSFYRKPGADVMLRKEEVDESLIRRSKIFHFGSLSLTDEPARKATMHALELARESGCLISYDPNLREPLWDSLNKAREQIAVGLTKCHILKISDNEIQWFTGIDNFDEGVEFLQNNYPNIKLICLSMGADGSCAYYKDKKYMAPAIINPKTIEKTGAGDTFGGCMLSCILDNGLEDLDEEKMVGMLKFANAAASIVTTRKGALRVMPNREEIENLVK